MTIHHHPSGESILAYANGSLQRALALALGAHIESCAECRENLAMAEELGGSLLETMPPADVPESALFQALDQLDVADAQSASATPRPFRERFRQSGARRWLAPGIWMHTIFAEGGERVYLLGAAPGKKLPRHGHKGVEMTQVLEGAFSDGTTRYGPGDFLEAGEEIEHTLQVSKDAPCVCLIASESVPGGLAGLLMRLLG